MLVIARKYQDLHMGQLLDLCVDSIRTNGLRDYPRASEEEQLFRAQADIYQYLQCEFFQNDNTFCAFWVVEGRYVCTLRVEPYRDGLIISALETAPDMRGRGYAKVLIQHVVNDLRNRGSFRMYSHIDRRNKASVSVHLTCGFRKISDTAVYLDGSVSSHADTYLYEIK